MKNNKKGISLIVLVITIIVMIVLAGTIILTLNNAGLIDKASDAVEKTDLKTVQTLATLKWSDAFLAGKTTQEELEEAVLEGLEKENIDPAFYEIIVTENGVEVTLKAVPSAWKGKVVAIVDGVPIPKGFVASSATGENTKAGGLVIYEGTEQVTDANVEKARRARNQYVWVPIAKENFTTKFVRQNFGLPYTISNTLEENYWEVVLDITTNMPLSTQNSNYVSSTTLAEVQAMYASVKEYEGFYMSRYEAGIDTQRMSNTTLVTGKNVYSMMGKIPYTYIPWASALSIDTGGAVEVARSIYPTTDKQYGVVSTLTYGVQWDSTLQWWLDTNAVTTESTVYGNHYTSTIEAKDLNDGAQYADAVWVEIGESPNSVIEFSEFKQYQPVTSSSTKASREAWALTTGALKTARVNNIYDMSGNMLELTMEAVNITDNSSSPKIRRGIDSVTPYDGTGIFKGLASRWGYPLDYAQPSLGFRISLYIKK